MANRCMKITRCAALKNPFDNPHYYWYDALELPGALQMAFVKKLVETYPLVGRVPDQSIIIDSAMGAGERIQATRGNDFMWVNTRMGKPFTIIDTKIKIKIFACLLVLSPYRHLY